MPERSQQREQVAADTFGRPWLRPEQLAAMGQATTGRDALAALPLVDVESQEPRQPDGPRP